MKTAMEFHEEESKTDKIMDSLLEDPEVKALLLSKLRAISPSMPALQSTSKRL